MKKGSYAALRKGVDLALVKGAENADRARVRTYWNAGKMIGDHLRAAPRASRYGKVVIGRLSRDLGVEQRLLYRCVRFAERFPALPARPKLGWTQYRVLSEVDDETKRAELARAAETKDWSSRELEEAVRKATIEADGGGGEDFDRSGQNVLRAKRGRVGVYRLKERGGMLAVDLGFEDYLTPPLISPLRGRQEGSLVRIDGRGKVRTATDARKAHLFTYKAKIDRVVDGDTLWLMVELRAGHLVRKKIRLRGVDCAEINGAERRKGRKARRFVQEMVGKAQGITITTTKPDKYDRYLCDIFLRTAAKKEIFLNNALLEGGHAVRKTDYSPLDWENV